MKLKRILATVLAVAMVLSMMSFSVFATASTITVSNSDELIAALADEDANVTITMLNDITVEAGLSNAYGKTGINILYGQTLDGNGYTLTVEGANGTWDSAISTTGGTIKNLTIDSGFRGVFVNHNSTYSASVVLENVVIDGPTYTISCDQATNNGLIATNSTFNGWTSYAATIGEVKFINCNFGKGAGYAFCRPYAPTTFDACNFEEGYKADTRAETEMTYCKLNGELITSENIGALCTSNVENATANDEAVADKVAYIPGVGGFDTFEAALKSLKENSVLEILSDVTIDYKWDNRNTGAKIKVPVTINGNGKTIKFTNIVNDGYNYLSAFRFEAAATVNNLTIDMSEAISEFQGRFRAISAKSDLTVDSCNFIGSTAYNNTRAIIFGEGAEDAIGDVEVNISDSTFTNWRRGVSDNENKQDAKSVAVTDSLFTNASINVSASEEVTITGNEIDGSYFNVTSYTQPNELFVTVTGNNLDEEYADYNAIQAGKTIDAQEDVVMPKVTAVSNSETYYYSKLSYALANGGEITLNADATLESANIKADTTIDLNGNTLTVNAVGIMDNASGATAAVQAWADVVIKNGDIVVTSVNQIGNGVFYISGNGNSSLTIEDVNMTATNTNGTDLVVSCSTGALNIIDSEINATGVSKLVNGGDNGTVVINNSNITVSDSKRVMVNVVLDADDSSFMISNLSDNALRNISGTITNTKIDAHGYENGIKNDAGLALTIDGTSVVTLTGAKDGAYDIHLKNGAILTISDTAIVEADDTFIEGENAVTGNIVNKADSIYVQYRKVDKDTENNDNLEGADKYEIVLVGANEEKINELASADLTFDFVGTPSTNAAMSYFVKEAYGVSLTQLGDRFMFNYDGVTKYQQSGLEIVIGTITVEGYGSYTLGTKDVDTNAVYATEIRNNIVDGFEDAATLVINDTHNLFGEDMNGKIEDGKIAIPTRTLTINIDFPNKVEDQNKAYQDMKVEITGNIDGKNQTVEYKLGTDGYKMDNGSYVVTENRLVLNNAYTVTVSGAGYRTARYTVTMTEDKTINFWNNVMDNDTVVEEDKHSETKNFLAGDIVKDNKINIYDLSAVVSYFGTENLVAEHPEYAKYDLNRDGLIDSKDVAYVLVSWGE